MKDEGYSSGSILISFVSGGIVGAGLALLFAPQSGDETRKKISVFADDLKDRTTDYVEKTKEKITSYVDEGKGLYEQKKSMVKSGIEAGKEAYEREKERLSKEQKE
jgi:gas vesicle protein